MSVRQAGHRFSYWGYDLGSRNLPICCPHNRLLMLITTKVTLRVLERNPASFIAMEWQP